MSAPVDRRAARWWIGALIFAALFWILDLAVLRAGVPHPLDDNWEDNLIAGLLLEGQPFRTLMVYPPLWGYRDPETLTVPVLIHGPLLPLLTAIPLRVLGPAALDGIAWAAALVAWLTVIPIYRLGARHIAPAVGATAAGLYTAAPLTIEAVHHSGSVVLGALLLACALDLAMRARPRAGVAGLVAGVGYLVRPEMLLAAPLIAWLAASPPAEDLWSARTAARLRAALRFAAGFVLFAAPWWWHHAAITGSPLFNLSSYTLIGYWGGRPGASVLHDFALTPERFRDALQAALPELPAKWAAFFPRAAKHALFAPSGGTGWLALAGVAVALSRRGPARRLAIAALFLVAIPLASMTLTVPQRFYLIPCYPLFALGAAAGACALFQRLPEGLRRPRAWIGALALAMIVSTGPALRAAADEARLLETRIRRERGRLADLYPPGSGVRAIFSDTPDFVAWTTGRPTFWIYREEFERLYRGGQAPFGLPPRDSVGTWFHADPGGLAEVGAPVSY